MGGGCKSAGSAGHLDGEWTFQAQFRALAAAAPGEDDLTFREASVQDISDRGREAGAARLKRVFAEVFPRPPSPEAVRATKMRALTDRGREEAPCLQLAVRSGGSSSSLSPAGDEAQVRRTVEGLVARLRALREEGAGKPDGDRDSELICVMRQLEALRVSVGCLKATKVAAELNSPSWRTGGFGPDVQGLAASLVKRWRAMYKAEYPSARRSGPSSTMSDDAWAMKCQNVSMDLEEAAHSLQQKSDRYCELVSSLCRVLLSDPEACRGLLIGATRAKELAEFANHATSRKRRGAAAETRGRCDRALCDRALKK